MIRISIMALLLGWMTLTFAGDYPVGWYWYNEIPIQKKQKEQQEQTVVKKDFSQMSAGEQLALYQKGLAEAKAQAVLYTTVQNVKTYLELQQFAENHSAQFAAMYEPVFLQNPQLDYQITHPMATAATQMRDQAHTKARDRAIQYLAATHGILFFYRGSQDIDLLMSKIVADFAKTNNVAVLAVSVDGKVSPYFRDSRVNQGQAQSLGIKALPAVVLVNPKNTAEPPTPVAYGFLSKNDLEERFYDVAVNFKPRY